MRCGLFRATGALQVTKIVIFIFRFTQDGESRLLSFLPGVSVKRRSLKSKEECLLHKTSGSI